MADLSALFNPALIEQNQSAASDAVSSASDAGSKAAVALSKASDASSAAAAKLPLTAFNGLSRITVGSSAPESPDEGDLWVDTSSVLSGTISDALSKCAVNSDAASSALALASDAASKALLAQSKASEASAAAAGGSNALSKITARSSVWDKASAASSAVEVAKSAASDAASAASDAASKALVALSKGSDASSAASNSQSKITARSAIWDQKTVILKVYNEASAIAVGDGKMFFAIPAALNGMNLVSAGGHLYTAATSGVVAVQVRNVTSGVDMLSAARKLEWDATEKDTATAAASSVARINTDGDGVATGEEIAIDIDAAASGAKGLEVRLTFRTP